jgi:hypothetical protein
MNEEIFNLANSINEGEWFSDDLDLVEFSNKLIHLKHEELICIIAQCYQVIGVLANECGRFDDEHVMKALDNTSGMRMIHDDVLPFPSKIQPEERPVAWWNRTKDTVSTDPVHRHNKDCVPLYVQKV